MYPRKTLVLAAALCAYIAADAATGGTARADALKSKLKAVEQDLTRNREQRVELGRAADRAARELKQIQRRGIELARSLYRHSAKADQLEANLQKLEQEERTKAEAMARRRGQLAATMAALQRMARMPAATLVAIPQPPDDTIRSAILLRAAVPKLQTEAAGLAQDLRALAALRDEIEADRTSLADTLRDLDRERVKLAALTEDKMALVKNTRTAEQEAAQRTARLSARAGSLRELLQKLSDNRKTPALRGEDFEPPPAAAPVASAPPEEPSPAPRPPESAAGRQTAALAPITLPRGSLPAPGRVVTAFGDTLANGTQSKGVYIQTRSAAPVVAPRGGRVVFAGKFRGYGNLVILELPNRGHALISGMSRITAGIGDNVLAGEPLGEMTPSARSAPKLYFELRRRGRPINPLPPDAARRNKVRG